MPLDPSFSDTVGLGDKITPDSFNDRFDLLENFVNGGISVEDIQYATESSTIDAGVTPAVDPRTNALESRHILRPEYYISANPRVDAVSSSTYYRNVSDGKMNRHVRHETSGQILAEFLKSADVHDLPASAWQPIDGMSANIYVKGTENVDAFVCGSMYAHASGATDFYGMSLADQAQNYGRGPEEGAEQSESQWKAWYRARAGKVTIGIFKLYVDRPDSDTIEDFQHTERRLFARGQMSYRSRRSQISFATRVTLSPGMNKVSYRCVYRLPAIDSRLQQHLYIDARNFFVDVHYK